MLLYDRVKSNLSNFTRKHPITKWAARALTTSTLSMPLISSGQKWNAPFLWPLTLIMVAVTIASSCGVPTNAAVDRILPFSARLKGTSGDIVPDGNYQLTFKIYTSESGGTALWSETQTISVTDGVVVTTLGNSTTFPASLTFNDGSYYLGITVESDAEMSPRKRIGAVPVAFNADTVDGYSTTQTGAASSVTVTDASGGLTLQGGLTIGDAILPSSNGTINLGSSTAKFGTIYANSISAGSTEISGTTSESFSINTDQATNNTEDASVRFYLGPTLNTHAALQWSGTNNRFELYSRLGSSTLADIRLANATATGNMTIGGALSATGATTLGSTLGVTGATTLSSTLGVTGATTLSSTLGVTGATTLSSTLAVTGNSTFTGDIAVNGGDITTTATTLNIDVADTGVIQFRDGSNNLVTITDAGTTGNLAVSGNTSVTGTLGATGATTLGSTLAVTGATTLSSTLGVTSNATIGGTLGVTGATTLSSTLGVTGATTLSSTLGVTGDTTLSSALGVTGLSTLGKLTVNGDSTSANTDITLGDASTDQLVVNAAIASNLVPVTDNTYDLGASNKRWANFYAANAVFDSLSTPNTTANDFYINSDNATADTEDMTLQFERGSTSPNAIIGWNSTSDYLYSNVNWVMQGNTTLGDASGDSVTSNAATWTFANDTAVALSGGVNGLNFDSNTLSIDATNDRVGIGTAAPSYKLQVNTSASNDIGLYVNNSGGGTTTYGVRGDIDSSSFTGTGYGVYGSAVGSHASAVFVGGYFTATNGTCGGCAYALLTGTGNVGIGESTPAALFTVGSGDLFQVNSSGAIAAATGITSTGQLALTTTGSSAGILIGGDAPTIYRSASGQLNIGSWFGINSAGLLTLSRTGTDNAAGIVFGAGDPVNLYWDADGLLTTDDSLKVVGTVTVGGGGNLTFASTTTTTTYNALGSQNKHQFYVDSVERVRFDVNGQVQIPTTGSSAGILLGGDAQIYRGAADILRTPDSLRVDSQIRIGKWDAGDSYDGTLGASGRQIVIEDNTSTAFEAISHGSGNVPLFIGRHSNGTAASPTASIDGDVLARLQGRGSYGSWYDAGYLQFAVDGNAGVGDMPGRLQVFLSPDGSSTPTEVLRVANTGQLRVPTTGSSAGILLGGDAQIYRSAADQLRTPDSLVVDSLLRVGTVTGTVATTPLSARASNAAGVTSIEFINSAAAQTGNETDIYLGHGPSDTGLVKLKGVSTSGVTNSEFRLSVVNSTSWNENVLVVNNTGQLQLSTTGSTGGVLLGGDAQLYRSAADTIRTDDLLTIGGAATTGKLSVTGSANAYTAQLLGSETSGQSYGMYLEAGTNSSDQSLLVRDATGATNYLAIRGDGRIGVNTTSYTGQISVDAASGLSAIYASGQSGAYTTRIQASTSSGNSYGLSIAGGTNSSDRAFLVQDATGVTNFFAITGAGQIQAPVTGSSAGILIGGDAQLYRSAADTLRTPDSLTVDGNLVVSGTVTSGTINSQTISSAANFTGTVTVATSVSTPIVTSASALALTSGSNGAISITPNGTGDIKLVVSGNASQDVFIGDGGTTNYTKFDTNGAVTFAGSARPYSEITLLPDDAVLPAANNCARNQTNATNISYFTLDCDAATDESAFWQFKMPQNYANGTNIQIDIYWEANATSGAAVFDTAYVGVAEGENFDGASLTSVSGSADTTAGTAYYLNTATLTMTSPSIDANDIVNFKLIRNADTGSDDLSVDAKVIKVRLRFLTGS